jgi:hypothetical protein
MSMVYLFFKQINFETKFDRFALIFDAACELAQF